MTSVDTRPRFNSKQPDARDELYRILQKHVTIPTKIKYTTDLMKGKIQKAQLITHGSLLLDLRALQCNMSFSKAAMKDQLKQLAVKQHTSWRLSADEVENFSSTMSDRVRCMCRHFMQASSRPHPPKWVSDIDAKGGATASLAAGSAASLETDDQEDDQKDAEGEEQEEEEIEGEEEEEEIKDENEEYDDEKVEEKKVAKEEEADDSKYFMGWDAELGYAWRVLAADGIKGRKEPATDILFKVGANDDDFCEASWADGFKHELPNLTVGEFKARSSAKTAAKRSTEPLWSGLGYFVRLKIDRHPLVWLGKDDKKSKQICQLRIDKMSSEKDAVELMAEVGRGLAEGRTADPYSLRDELLKIAASSSSSTSASSEAKKRPAAAPAAAARAAAAPAEDVDEPLPTTPKKKAKIKAPIQVPVDMTFSDSVFAGFDQM